MGSNPVRFEFECPNCHERIVVDAPIYDDLLADGCYFCDGVVTAADFDRKPPG